MGMLNYALSYARRGWRVFPVDSDKKPMTLHGFKDATTDERVIRDWWQEGRQLREPNIGLDIPEGIVVLDFDPRNMDEESTFQQYDYPSTKKVYTPGAGWHLYFIVPKGLQFRGQLAPGVDVKAAGKGYVLLPPSKLEDGRAYIWADDRAAQPLPADILNDITKTVREITPRDFSGEKAYFPWETASRYGAAALRKACARLVAVDNGARNKCLYIETKDITRLVNGGEIAVERLADIRDAALESGLSYYETQATMESAYTSVGTEYRKAPRRG
jgi:Bifunctional DNA primase/polymerase, N-terminal